MESRVNSKSDKELFVVGLGASAGGLDPLKQFFGTLPERTGMAYIVVMHLSAEHVSRLSELLQPFTVFRIHQVKKKTPIEPDCVYVIPPGKQLSVKGNDIVVSRAENKPHAHKTVDLLFSSLGESKGNKAVGIILSGSGSDGVDGLKVLKESGGYIIAQDPKETQFNGMPLNAIQTGLVDMVLPVNQISHELIQLRINIHKTRITDQENYKETLQKILDRIHFVTGHNFTNYKEATILRRIGRRMHINSIESISNYYDFLNAGTDEPNRLFRDLLISVTNFFRDPKAFKALEKEIIPELFNNKSASDQMRVWIPGCATGEEAYSIAILLDEYASKLDSAPGIQIFATDIDEQALKIARRAQYFDSIEDDITPERLNRYFNKIKSKYHVSPEIAGKVLFAQHNMLRDAPFSRLDLIVCRNLLIYLDNEIQTEVFNLFHYALRPKRWIFLGLSDSRLKAGELFNPVNKEYRIYQRNSAPVKVPRLPVLPLQIVRKQRPDQVKIWRTLQSKADFDDLQLNQLLKIHNSQCVIVNEKHEVIHSTDGIDRYLSYAGGKPSLNILKMVKPDLRHVLKNLMFQVEKSKPETLRGLTKTGIEFEGRQITIHVNKIIESDLPGELMHVIIQETGSDTDAAGRQRITKKSRTGDVDEGMLAAMEKELDYTSNQLRIAQKENDTSGENLKAYNEELQSMNEELHSTGEELETALEELHSVNEELKIVNSDLEDKVEKLSRANSDIKNLMEAIEVGILFLDRDFCINHYTRRIKDIFSIIPGDLGRSLNDITHKLKYDSLKNDLESVLKSRDIIKKIVNTDDERWYIMRLQPYVSVRDELEGVVVTFVEITQLKDAEERLKQQNQHESLATLGMYALEVNDIDAISKRAVQQLCRILKTDNCILYRLDSKKRYLNLDSHEGFQTEKKKILNTQKWDAGFALSVPDILVVNDYKNENRFRITPVMKQNNVESGIHIKIRGAEDTYGIVSLYSNEKDYFSRSDQHFAQAIANIIGMSVERIYSRHSLEKTNRQLKKAIRKSESHQRELLNHSIVERWEIGSYLHDNLAQMLASSKIMLSGIGNKVSDGKKGMEKDITGVIRNIDEALESIRDLSHDVLPVDVEEEGVAHAFKFLVSQARKVHNVKCTLSMDESIGRIKNTKLATNIYHVVQEAIKNAVVHGKAKNVDISIQKTDGDLRLEIKDDGDGVVRTSSKKRGRGVRIMRYRIELLGGTFSFKKNPGVRKKGAIVVCTIPFKELK